MGAYNRRPAAAREFSGPWRSLSQPAISTFAITVAPVRFAIETYRRYGRNGRVKQDEIRLNLFGVGGCQGLS